MEGNVNYCESMKSLKEQLKELTNTISLWRTRKAWGYDSYECNYALQSLMKRKKEVSARIKELRDYAKAQDGKYYNPVTQTLKMTAIRKAVGYKLSEAEVGFALYWYETEGSDKNELPAFGSEMHMDFQLAFYS